MHSFNTNQSSGSVKLTLSVKINGVTKHRTSSTNRTSSKLPQIWR